MNNQTFEYKQFELSDLDGKYLSQDFFWCKAHYQNQQDYDELINEHWPDYLLEPSDIGFPDFFSSDEKDIYKKRHNLIGIRCKKTQQLIACLSTTQINAPTNTREYPDDGWLWAYRSAHKLDDVNTIILQQATVHRKWRGYKLANKLIEATKYLAANYGFQQILVPLRPVSKHQYPDITFETFINKVLTKEIADPWINIHLENGGTLLNDCSNSVVVRASVDWWQKITKQKYQDSGFYQIKGGLVPLNISLENNIGDYSEPNIWVRYHEL